MCQFIYVVNLNIFVTLCNDIYFKREKTTKDSKAYHFLKFECTQIRVFTPSFQKLIFSRSILFEYGDRRRIIFCIDGKKG